MLLYINGNYPHHSLHGELVSKLADLGNDITVFVPMKGNELNGKYRSDHPRVDVIYCDCLKTTDRVFFINKIQRIVRRIEEHIDMTKVDCILAGTIYSDGFPAYILSKKHNIPFAVAVRETDVTYQMKWRPYLNIQVQHLLNKASKIIYLSPAYQSYIDKFHCSKDKYIIIPNAVNDFWFQNQGANRELHTPISLIYVGEISKRKNVETTINVIAKLKEKGINVVFHVVGSGNEEGNCRDLAIKMNVEKQVLFHGWQKDKRTIKEFYDQADIFVMISYRETFGTVYIEALTQGLPIIYTKDQGIDGFFDEGIVGYGCNPTDIIDIACKISGIINQYSTVSEQCIKMSRSFTWEIVASQYQNVINSMRMQ